MPPEFYNVPTEALIARQPTEAELAEILEASQVLPLFHMEEVQGITTLEEYQKRMAYAIWANERTAIRSCHCMGKTWTMARIVLAIGSAFPGCKIITTAPTARQVELLLWSEIRAGHQASKYPLGGKILTKKWEFTPDWWVIGFTSQKQSAGGEGQANSGFQGFHSPVLVFVVFDEATGIVADIWKQLEGLMTSAHVKFVAIGNPTSKSTPFFKCFSDPTFKKIHLSCFDSPNLPANGFHNVADLEAEVIRLKEMGDDDRLNALSLYKIPRPHLITARWVMTMALNLGTKHPLFVSKCLGDFPEEDENCLFPLGVVEEAQRRPRELDPKAKFSLGVDVARMGMDKSVLTMLRGKVHTETRVRHKRETTEITGEAVAMVNALTEEEILRGGCITVDATGIGSGVLDELRQYQRQNMRWRNIEIRQFHSAETFQSPRDGRPETVLERTEKYANKKAESFILLGRDVRHELALLAEDIYLEELPTINFKYNSKGRYIIEDKDAYKKRTGRGSPDHSDSLSLANYGRYDFGGAATFTADMAKPKGRPMVKGLGRGGDEP